jgi:hypothetical protein
VARIAVLLGLMAVFGSAPGQAGIAVALLPSTLTVSPGATFDVEVVVTEAGSSFNGFDAIVGHDPAALTLVPLSPLTLQEGPLMTAACGNRFHRFRSGVDRDTATVVLLCSGVSVTGPGTVYRLRYQASMTPQVTTLQFLPGLRFYDAGLAVPGVVPSSATITIGTAVGVEPGAGAARGSIAAWPNPFAASTRLRVDVPAEGAHALGIFDSRGRIVRRLSNAHLAPGPREIAWDGLTDAGMPAPAGLYFARLTGVRGSLATRLVRLRAE